MKKNNYKLLTATLVAVLACVNAASAVTSTWNVASGNWSNQFNWNPVGDPNNSSYSVIFNNGGSLTLDGDRTVGNYSQTGGAFTISNGRTLALNNGGSLDGGGVMNLVNATMYQSAANVLFTNTNGTIQGYGQFGYVFGISLLNQANGIIQADVSGQNLLFNSFGVFTNNGLMRAMNGGQLLFNGSSDVINNATIRSENGSNVRIENRIVGGTLDNTGSTGTLTLNGGKLRNVTIAAGSTVTNGNDGGLENTLINLGTLSTSASSSLMHIASNTTLSGGGAIALVNGTFTDGNNNLALTNSDNVLRGYGSIGYNRTLSVINGTAGIIQADVSGQNLLLQGSGTFTNNGLMRAMNGGQLVFNGSPDVINNATIRSENSSNVRIENRIVGGTLDNTGSTGTLTLNGGKLRDVTIAAGSTVTNGNDGRLENTLINLGTLSTGSSFTSIPLDTTLSGGGAITLANGAITDENNGRTLTNSDNVIRGYGTIGYNRTLSVINGTAGIIQADVSGQNLSLDGSGSFTNNGLFAARNGGTLSRSTGTFTNFSGSTLTGGAYLADNSTLSLNIGPIVTNAATVVLSGPSSIFTPINSIGQNDGTFVITNGRTFGATPLQADSPAGVFPNAGTLIIGPNDSTLTITGDYSQGSGSVLEIVLGGDYPNANFHHLNVTGSASLAGTLEVKLANGYVPGTGQIEIIHGGAINGGFVTVNGATVTYTSTGVFINATGNTNALQMTKAVSRKTHGPAGALDINLPLTGGPGVECRNSGGNHTLVFTFTNNVLSGLANLATQTGGSISGSPIFSGKTMTVNLTGVTNAQDITVTLSGVTDVFSQVLPNTPVSMGALVGDTTGNGAVNSSDISQTKAQSGAAVGQANCRQDVTVNGAINSSDIALVKSKSGTGIP